jgi:hypothetical protein
MITKIIASQNQAQPQYWDIFWDNYNPIKINRNKL